MTATTPTNLYNTVSNTSSLSGGWGLGIDVATTGFNMLSNYFQGQIQGERAEFQAKAQGAMQSIISHQLCGVGSPNPIPNATNQTSKYLVL